MMSRMEFDCKLAYLKEIKRISGFNSVKELYERVSQAFSVPTSEILFCTLNTHNFRDMNSLLGNYLSLGDLIVVHLCGKTKKLAVKKTQEYLGLTITDNGIGRAFVKKVRPNEGDDSGLDEEFIKPGDHIAAINTESTVGMRHYEVAKAIREVPQNTDFTLHLIEPLYSNEYFNGRCSNDLKNEQLIADLKKDKLLISLNCDQISISGQSQDKNQTDEAAVDKFDASLEYLVDSSLPIDKLLSKGACANDRALKKGDELENSCADLYRHTIEKINSILESFLGINDNALAIQIYRLAKENNESFDCFVGAIKSSELSVFDFNEDIETYLWNCVTAID